MSARTIGFSIPEEDEARLDELAGYFAQGNRSAFLRMAMKRMEAVRRAQELRDLQSFGVTQRAVSGHEDDSVEVIVHRVLARPDSQ